jgi:hypothetical protein
MTVPILPSEVIANCRHYAERNSVTGMAVWDIITTSCPDTNFLDRDRPGFEENYGTGEMCAEVIVNTFDGFIYDLEDDKEKLLISSGAFIRLLDVAKDQYDIANYERRDGRIWAIEERCWADEL